MWNGPWIICGDFNEVLSQHEHIGPRDCSEQQMAAFRECLRDCKLRDLGFSGHKFTWCNRQDPNSLVKVRLDRAMVNSAFTDCFDGCYVENIVATSSDHYAIRIGLSLSVQEDVRRPVQQGFKFEAMWLRLMVEMVRSLSSPYGITYRKLLLL